uniref:Branched-chain amino acid transport system ATP-binding protein n=1 Tax=Candidatus Kentrum sp. TC TaxID=2126339 RepID=A0A451A1M8_9GAMM|nr:MAG: branched-chain amino acid transport system ATP-binding protein [Candidatus Kentron sp. TC]
MSAESCLQVKNLTVRRGWRVLAEKIDLTVNIGERIYIHGGNGTGKSTLLESLIGLHRDCRGEHYWLGRKGTPVSHGAFMHGSLVYIPQHHGLFPSLTLKENILLKRGVENSMAEQRMAELLDRFPELSAAINRRPGRASAGQRQLAACARVFMHKPKLLVLDEPTAGLAEEAAERLFELMEQWVLARASMLMTDQNRILGRKVTDVEYRLDNKN